MREGTRGTPVLERRLDEGLVAPVVAAALDAPAEERLGVVLDELTELADEDPRAARLALWELRGDRATLAQLEEWIGGSPDEATLALGAAIQLAGAELSSPAPDLRRCLPELRRWLERRW
jgi:hypothetical protein